MRMTVKCAQCGESTTNADPMKYISSVPATAGLEAELEHESQHHFESMKARYSDPDSPMPDITSRPSEFEHGKDHNA